SGVPSIFVPHGYLYDQTYWAALAHELGCASRPIPISKLTAEELAAAIRSSAEYPDYSLNAAALAKQVQSEPGVVLARHLIEQLVEKIEVEQGDRKSRAPEENFQAREERAALRKQFHNDRRSHKTRRTGRNNLLD